MQWFRSTNRSGSRKKSPTRRRGAATVETALVLPVFFLVLMGIVEVGRAMMVAQLLNNAAREGCRAGIMTGSTNAEVSTTVEDILGEMIGTTAADITVSVAVTEFTGNPPANNQVASAHKRDLCVVSVEVPYDKVSWIPITWFSNRSLSGVAAMRHE
ncbi:MAG: TadE/TadG family type IV pilus assembly protein [Planctomycetaceae bacterium]